MTSAKQLGKILLVDRDPAVSQQLKRSLEQAGYSVFAAQNNIKALEAIIHQSPDLVLMELVLPGLNGLELLQRIRSARSRLELPVLILSSYNDAAAMVAAFDLGADDYLTKPFLPEVVLARIRSQIALGAARRAGTAKQPNQVGKGRYQMERLIGIGGFSQTYLARDTHRPGNPLCVVKRLRHMDDKEDKDRTEEHEKIAEIARAAFEREAQILEKLGHHPYIPKLLAHFEEDGQFYTVQDFVRGSSLRQHANRGVIWSPAQTAHFLCELLKILVFVHQHGVIHGDIKPSNIIQTRRDKRTHFTLIDFGAIQHIDGPPGQDPFSGVFIGTGDYAPPEQLSGCPRFNSDIFALGRVAVEMSMGTLPRIGEPLAEAIPFGFGDPRLLAILERMVTPDADARYPTAQALLDEIRPLYRQLLAECARPSRQPVLVEPEEMEITAAGRDRG
ncbi:protein kinase domain-containing protein [Synechococcus sp. OH20]|uniref:protein kinase domain-containing protein n=1 Tax=Synechococcus sp. OH20 TaxID=139337 RepID=UPI0039C5DE42